ncbi:sensor histidine kinase [Larkinella sp. VNQ87]|uniref:sensor histidine kinase n=1 Tax=Larkinella sp. VNQ87 TaxID=3400921 RepID=UPI003C0B37CE
MKIVTNLLLPLLLSAMLTQFLLNQLRNFLDTATRFPAWDQWLRRFWMGSLVFAAVGLLLPDYRTKVDDWYFLSFFAMALATLILARSYRPAQTLLVAFLPLTLAILVMIVLVSTQLVKNLSQYETYISSGFGFSAAWLLAFNILAVRQRKTFERERLAQLENERMLKAAETQKIELERLVAERTAVIQEQKEELETALTRLKTTQDQLIQSEKLASLGSLTAGIAHEIQNPLNFVTNFSDVSTELIQEMRDEVNQLDQPRPVLSELLGYLDDNLQKITHHGQRASAIVKGMLDHSRSYDGERQPTNLNALAEEYLRLAYHGFRAKNKAFQAELVQQFDPALPEITIVPQEIGRVLLNLFDNAFYAVREKAIQQPGQFSPTVSVKTVQSDGRIRLEVSDNGSGIDPAIQASLFQPFFTTKPTGQGTGLGLSLSYDIITKGHNGSLAVQSRVGEGAQFIIELPVV